MDDNIDAECAEDHERVLAIHQDFDQSKLQEIEREFTAMGVTPEWVDDYVRISQTCLDPAAELPCHNGRMILLPPGTMPDTEYVQVVNRLIQNIEKAQVNAKVAERALAEFSVSSEHASGEYIKYHGKHAHEQLMAQQTELFR